MNQHLSTVVHPLHEASHVADAQALWNAGEYTACLAALEAAPPSAERYLLAARAWSRLRRYDDALASLAAGNALFTDSTYQAEADALSAVLHEIKRNRRESDVFYDRAARALSKDAGRVANSLALCDWMRRRHEQCLRHLRIAETSDDAQARAQAFSIRSWINGAHRQFERQADLLRAALDAALSVPEFDTGVVAETLQTLSHRCRELYLPEHFEALCAAARDLPWGTDLRIQHYNTLRHIGWTYALNGQYVIGLRQLASARQAAPNDVLRAASLLDAAWVTWASGEHNGAEAHLQDALEILAQIDWTSEKGEEVWALLLAAELCVTIQRAGLKAAHLLERYDAIKNHAISAEIGVAHNRAFDPIEAHVRALVSAASGNVGPARKLAKQAYRQFAAMGYQWRAARCALFLYESGCGDTWLAAANEQAKNYPRSFIGAQLERIRCESSFEPLSRLTPRQRDVVRRLVEGDTVVDVAAALNTSPGTVRVHLKHIHRALGVRNRVELLRAVKRPA